MKDLDKLRASAIELAQAAGEGSDLAERASRLAERLCDRRFYISVAGEFKRGKSTLVNALVRHDVLPVGVLPLTAVATEISFGESPLATVTHTDGRRYEIEMSQVAEFVTEELNPNNERGVARLEIELPAAILETGMVLVDTPGIASIHAHNDAEARRAVLDADGAILVFSADSPMSGQDRDLLALLEERRGPSFFVVNKVDHFSKAEIDQVVGFVTETIERVLGRTGQLFCVSARSHLVEVTEQVLGPEVDQFEELQAALFSFVTRDLLQAIIETSKRNLGRIAQSLNEALSMEDAALALDAQELARRAVEFRAEGERQRKAFEDERTLLRRDSAALFKRAGERITEFSQSAIERSRSLLDETAEEVPPGKLESALEERVERAVEEEFDRFRNDEAVRLGKEWAEIAEDFRARTETRVNSVRKAAADLFTIALPAVAIPEVADESERFFYHFPHIDPLGEELMRALRKGLPAAVLRKRLLAKARERLAMEFDKHAGRTRWDLSQRLEDVRLTFEAAMTAELVGTIDATERAASRAEELRKASQAERDLHVQRTDFVRTATRRALNFSQDDVEEDGGALTGGPPPSSEEASSVGELVDKVIERAYEIASGPLEGINEPAVELAALCGPDINTMYQARKVVAERLSVTPDHTSRQVDSLLRRALELGEWNEGLAETNELP